MVDERLFYPRHARLASKRVRTEINFLGMSKRGDSNMVQLIACKGCFSQSKLIYQSILIDSIQIMLIHMNWRDVGLIISCDIYGTVGHM